MFDFSPIKRIGSKPAAYSLTSGQAIAPPACPRRLGSDSFAGPDCAVLRRFRGGWPATFTHRHGVSLRERLADLSSLRDSLHAQLRDLDTLIGQLNAEMAAVERQQRRFELGEVWGAAKLGRHLGVSENTARKVLRTELADVTWTDAEGRMRVNAVDVEKWITQRPTKRLRNAA